VVKQISEAFVWPKATRYEDSKHHDFDDETPNARFSHLTSPNEINFKIFPSVGFDRVIVVAGPGFGKTSLTLALAAENIGRGHLPVIISIPEFSQLDIPIAEYLTQNVNKENGVNIDWNAAADSGLLILLLDGLDEIAADRRVIVLEQIKRFALASPYTPWLLTVRDAAALPVPLGATVVELAPLDGHGIVEFIAAYSSHTESGLYGRIAAAPDIFRLARIPLFLAMLLSTLKSVDQLPKSRGDLIEGYLSLLFRPAQFKIGEPSTIDSSKLRRISEEVSFLALEQEEVGVTIRALERTISNHLGQAVALQEAVDQLIKLGVLRRSGPNRLSFPFPIVQEYLAACHILSDRPKEIPDRRAQKSA
jgi:predicted NACHT family NTPase